MECLNPCNTALCSSSLNHVSLSTVTAWLWCDRPEGSSELGLLWLCFCLLSTSHCHHCGLNSTIVHETLHYLSPSIPSYLSFSLRHTHKHSSVDKYTLLYTISGQQPTSPGQGCSLGREWGRQGEIKALFAGLKELRSARGVSSVSFSSSGGWCECL